MTLSLGIFIIYLFQYVKLFVSVTKNAPLDHNPKEDQSFYLMWICLSFGLGVILLLLALFFPKIRINPNPPNIFEIYKMYKK